MNMSTLGLHYKRDGTLDMSYQSSRDAVARQKEERTNQNIGGLHYKRDGTLDMSYKSSRHAVASTYR